MTNIGKALVACAAVGVLLALGAQVNVADAITATARAVYGVRFLPIPSAPLNCTSTARHCQWVDTNGTLRFYFNGVEKAIIDADGDAEFFDINVEDANFVGKISAAATAWQITDPGNGGAIAVTKSGVCNLTSGGSGQTRTLATPTFIGQEIDLAHDTDGGGDIVVTVASAFNQTGNTTITLNDAGDHTHLRVVMQGGTRRWRLIVNNGATLGP